ncbi:hypothetical protein HK104_006238, partial [Borealophlyctis nickersoniae]
MEPAPPLSSDWTEVCRTDTFTLGNGIVVLGGSKYKLVAGCLGVAVKVEGLIMVGFVASKVAVRSAGFGVEQTAPVPDVATAAEGLGAGTAGGTDQGKNGVEWPIPVIVNVLPSGSIRPFPLHHFQPNTHVGMHLVLLKGAYLDSECVLHGPFVYKGIRFGPNELIHADGVFARFHFNRDDPISALPKAVTAPPTSCTQQQQQPSQQSSQTQSQQQQQPQPPQQHRRIYVEICVDRMLNPLSSLLLPSTSTDDDVRLSTPPNTTRDATAASLAIAAATAAAAAIVTPTPNGSAPQPSP